MSGSPSSVSSNKAPILLFKHSEKAGGKSPLIRTPEYSDQLGGSSFISQTDVATFDSRQLTLLQWAELATGHPGRVKDYMMFPNSSVTMEGLWKSRAESPFSRQFSPEHVFKGNRDLISEVVAGMGDEGNGLVILYNPNTDQYQVEFRSLHPEVDASAASAADFMMQGAWQLTSMNGYSDTLSGIISSSAMVEQIEQGMRVLVVKNASVISQPNIVLLKSNGTYNTEIWAPRPGQTKPEGSSSAFLINDHVSERVQALDIIDALHRTAKSIKERDPSKKRIKVVSDLDGTLFDARAFVSQLFLEWAQGYEGERRDELTERVEWAQENKPSIFNGWNSQSVLQNLSMLDERVVASARDYYDDQFGNSTRQKFLSWVGEYEGVRSDDLKSAVKSAFDNKKTSSLLDKKNVRDILRGLGILDEQLTTSAMGHFNANFFSPDRRVDAPIIKGMVELVRLLQDSGYEMMFVTLRSKDDDTMSDGRSASEVALRRAGIWKNDRSILLRHEGEKLDWSEAAYKKGNNEPEKWQMVLKWRKSNRDSFVVGALENAPAHVKGYRDAFEYGMVYVHPQGDNPPHSPDLPDGVFTVVPDQLEREMDALNRSGFRPESHFSYDLDGVSEVWQPLMTNYARAIENGRDPVMLLDLNSTLLATSPISLLDDEVELRAGALNFVQELLDLGVEVKLLASHPAGEMSKELASSLWMAGLPLNDKNLELITRKDLGESEQFFKQRIEYDLADKGVEVIGVADSSNEGLVIASEAFSDAELFFVGDHLADGLMDIPRNAVFIENFDGGLGGASNISSYLPMEWGGKGALEPELTLPSYPVSKDPDLAERIANLPVGPIFSDKSNANRIDEITSAIFPRMDAIFDWALDAVAKERGKNPSDITVMEYGPGKALAPMASWAKSGAKVFWKEKDEARRQVTKGHLDRLPDDIRGRIEHVAMDASVKPDIVVWNYPNTKDPNEMVAELASDGSSDVKGFAGFFIVQTEEAEGYFFDDEPALEPMVDMPAGSGEYVMPSAYNFLGSSAFKMFRVVK